MPSQPALIFVTPAFGAAALGGLAVSARRIVGHLTEDYAVTVVTPSDLVPPVNQRMAEQRGVKLVEVGKVAENHANRTRRLPCGIGAGTLPNGIAGDCPIGFQDACAAFIPSGETRQRGLGIVA